MPTAENETKAVYRRPPVAQFTPWDQALCQIFGEFFAAALRPSFDGHQGTPFGFSTSAPDIDLYEDNNEIVVKAELPGMQENDIQIGFGNYQLFIKGEKKRDKGLSDENYYFSECSYGPFSRVLDLPIDIQIEKARRTFKNGILEIRLPKAQDIEQETIKIKG